MTRSGTQELIADLRQIIVKPFQQAPRNSILIQFSKKVRMAGHVESLWDLLTPYDRWHDKFLIDIKISCLYSHSIELMLLWN